MIGIYIRNYLSKSGRYYPEQEIDTKITKEKRKLEKVDCPGCCCQEVCKHYRCPSHPLHVKGKNESKEAT